VRSDNWCPGSGGAPSYFDKSAVEKTANKHYGKPIWSVKCVVCGRAFNLLSKNGPVPEHDRPHSAPPAPEPTEIDASGPDAPEAPQPDSSA
jgi:hypothetical protein